MTSLVYRNSEIKFFVYQHGRQDGTPSDVINPKSGGQFVVVGRNILVRAAGNFDEAQKEPPQVWVTWIDGMAAVSGIPLLAGGKETEAIEGIGLFFQLKY